MHELIMPQNGLPSDEKRQNEELDALDLEFRESVTLLAQKKADEASLMPNQLLPKKVLFERCLKELEEEFAKYRKQQTAGATALGQSLKIIQDESPNAFTDDIIQEINGLSSLLEIIEQDKTQVSKHLEDGNTLQDLVQISDEAMELLFQAAKRLFNNGQYVESRDAFAFLSSLNHTKYLYWLGLGYSEYRLRNFQKALDALSLACEANPDDPLSKSTLSRCYMETKL